MNRTNTDAVFSDDAFSRIDESDDRAFYSVDRMVSHLDTTALATVERLIGTLITEDRPRVLDLMASWDSHLPETQETSSVVGLGLNRNELRRNGRLTDAVVHDLNADPALPFADRDFDTVLCTVSVDYLTRPVEVFAEVQRVLKPGGLFLVVFSNRFFPEKAVAIWREATDDERIRLVERFLELAGGFTPPRAVISRGQPRPVDDRFANTGLPSDPIYAVFAERIGAGAPMRRAEGFEPYRTGIEPKLLERRKRRVAHTLRCPHCERPLSKWLVPQTPFTEWSSEHQFVCFNDACPHYVRGWSIFSNQRIPGSYRFMFDPDSATSHSIPVLTPTALRASIVSTEAGHDGPGDD